MQATHFRRTVLSAAIGVAMMAAAGTAGASAFGLVETGASGMGNAYAGAAAVAEDASTVWWNPAGMTRLDAVTVTGAVHSITISSKFSNGNSQPACVNAAICRPLGSNGGDAGDTAYVPNLYLSVPMGRLAFGLGVSVPFGLTTEYDSDWIGRYQAVKSDVKTLNVNPSLAFRINDMFSIGGGVSYQKIDAELTNMVNLTGVLAQAVQAGAIPAALAPSVLGASLGVADASARVKGNDSAYGWNLGLMMNLSPATRIGLAYRSSIKYDIQGDVSFNIPAVAVTSTATGAISQVLGALVQPGAQLSNGSVRASLKTPDSFNLSAAHDLNSKLQLLADISWTGWSTLPKLEFTRTSGVLLESVQYDWKDTWRYSLGAKYKLNDQWMLRGGVAYDQTPMDTTHRTPRLPDGDRTWVSAGVSYKFMPNASVDFGYTHIFIKDPQITNRNDGSTAGFALVDGTYSSNVNIFSLGATFAFR